MEEGTSHPNPPGHGPVPSHGPTAGHGHGPTAGHGHGPTAGHGHGDVEQIHIQDGGLSDGGVWLCCLPCSWLQRNTSVHKASLSVAMLLVMSLLVASPVLFLMFVVTGRWFVRRRSVVVLSAVLLASAQHQCTQGVTQCRNAIGHVTPGCFPSLIPHQQRSVWPQKCAL
ncbi:uncharacterized protein LOC128987981 [Macrosteles quadrilineatus]|uniref:uncharacterized protein LOC128987981 n=1 Tax=Macrosteles quadrilineatus TaxID=74068 RepID=UPI0023E29759|nr:uncharacterized protein LOC128987981 [Macrosteles quadrilineatus]